LQRGAIIGLGVLSVWLIVDVFKWVDGELPSILAIAATYGLAAYVILPYAVRMGSGFFDQWSCDVTGAKWR